MTTKKIVITLLSFFSLSAFAQQQGTLSVCTASKGRMYEGIGALSAGASSRLLPDYPEPVRSEILDALFKPMYGASLDHLKVEIGGDVNSTCGVEPSVEHRRNLFNDDEGYEWWLMEEAKRRNPSIKLDALEWGAPYWIGNGRFYSRDNAEYVAAFLSRAKTHHQLDIDYVGIWNETPFDVNYIKMLSNELKKNRLKTKIVAADEVCSWKIADRMQEDSVLMNSVDVIGTHYPPNGSSMNAQKTGKPIWASEEGATMRDWWQAACYLIKKFNHGYIDGKIVKHVLWSVAGAYYDILPVPESGLLNARTPWNGQFQLKPALWCVAHYTQFVHPGWRFCESASTYLDKEKDASAVSLFNPQTLDYSVIIETVDSKTDKDINIRVSPEMKKAGSIHVWQSKKDSCFIRQADVNVKDGIIAFRAEKGSIYSLTTTDGQHRINEMAADNQQGNRFPFPYSDDFNSYKSGKMPKYLSDQSGLFETTTYQGRKVLQQMVPQRGIEWLYHINPMPYSIIGDTAWTDYSVEANVMMPESDKNSSAALYGRLNGIYQHTITEPNSYWFRINADGTWTLGKTLPSLLNGHTSEKEGWKTLMNRMTDTKKGIIIPYQELKGISDSTMKSELKPVFDILSKRKDAKNAFLELVSFGMFDLRVNTPLAQGKWHATKGWHHIKMSFKGSSICVYLNNKLLQTINDTSFSHGMCGLGSSYSPVLFDDMKIKE